MNERAHAKINLCLDIKGIRENGYHDVSMIMQSLELCDDVEIEKADAGIELYIEDCREGKDKSSYQDSGAVPADKSNLMCRAAEKMKEEFHIPGGFRMKLKKRIPVAAGLAGGSSDAAAVLRGINRLCGLGADEERLKEIGVGLGADIPYCISGGLALSEGIGEELQSFRMRKHFHVLLIKPDLTISTKEAYQAYDHADPEILRHPDTRKVMKALEEDRAEDYRKLTGNVLEQTAAANIPEIRAIEEFMNENGADFSMMTGSGPTVFGLFSDAEKMHLAAKMAKLGIAGVRTGISDIIESEFIK